MELETGPRNAQRARRGWGPFTGGQLTAIIIGLPLVIGLPVVASAAIPNGNTYNACAAKSTGALRVIDASKKQKCKTTETKLSWSKTGAKGATGAAGANGTNGTNGTNAGAPLASGQSESGTFGARGIALNDIMADSISFTRPLPFVLSGMFNVVYTGSWPVAHCSNPGSAESGYLCVYLINNFQTFWLGPDVISDSGKTFGAQLSWLATQPSAYASGVWTVTG